MRLTATVTIYLPAHGEFKASEAHVTENSVASKASLARAVAQVYEGTPHGVAYWQTYPKYVLAIVLAGACHPLN